MLIARRSPGPLRVAMLSSRRAPALRYLLDETPGRGRSWDLVAFMTSDRECADADLAHTAGVPALVNDIRDFYRARHTRLTDLGPRPAFDRLTAALLWPHQPDLIVLCGYLHILSAPMLAAYDERIVNVHDADLSVTDAGGKPRYRGLHSTRDAIAAGARETRSTVHLVAPEVDVGPPLVRSWTFPVPAPGAGASLGTRAYAQREGMMRDAWGPLLARTIELIARGDVRLLGGRAVVEGILGPVELPAPVAARPAHPAAAGD